MRVTPNACCISVMPTPQDWLLTTARISGRTAMVPGCSDQTLQNLVDAVLEVPDSQLTGSQELATRISVPPRLVLAWRLLHRLVRSGYPTYTAAPAVLGNVSSCAAMAASPAARTARACAMPHRSSFLAAGWMRVDQRRSFAANGGDCQVTAARKVSQLDFLGRRAGWRRGLEPPTS